MKTRLLSLPLLIVLVASLAACGGGSVKVPANAIAVVGTVPITTADFNEYLKQAETVAAAQGPKPVPGTPQYTAMRNQVIAYLVQVNELEQQAVKEKVSVSKDEVTKYIANLAKTNYGGSMKKLEKALKAQGLSVDLAQKEVRTNLLAQKIHTKVTSTATVTTAEEKAYYKSNIANYQVAAQTSRSVAYILVKSKTTADLIEQKLANGASFAAMAKQYSTDTTTASTGGKYTVTKGGVVPAFQASAFSLKTGDTSAPVDATSTENKNYGWFIIQALGPVQNTKARTGTFAEEEASIKATLLQQNQDKLWQQWLADLKQNYESKVHYQSGYEPPATTALSTTNSITTTGTG